MPRYFLPVLTAAAVLFSGCAISEHPESPNLALIKCPVSPEQAATGQHNVKRYLAQVAAGKKPRATNRYVAVKTLPPNKKQTAAYIKKRQEEAQLAAAKNQPLPSKWVPPSQLSCVMIFDTQSQQFVGTVCYVVSSLPPIGESARFDTISAEFIGTGSEGNTR